MYCWIQMRQSTQLAVVGSRVGIDVHIRSMSGHLRISGVHQTPRAVPQFLLVLLTADPFGVGVVDPEVSSEEVANSHLALERQTVILTCEKGNNNNEVNIEITQQSVIYRNTWSSSSSQHAGVSSKNALWAWYNLITRRYDSGIMLLYEREARFIMFGLNLRVLTAKFMSFPISLGFPRSSIWQLYEKKNQTASVVVRYHQKYLVC